MRTLTRLTSGWLATLLLLSLSACAANTAYSGTPVSQLSDEQLVEELGSVLEGLGVELNRTMYLMAIRPEPAYVLTSSTTTFSGALNATYSAYSMPVGYGSSTYGTIAGSVRGTATTRYQYTDVNAGARLGNTIAMAVSQARRRAYRRRGEEVWAEYQRRVTERRERTEALIQEFFAANPELEDRRMLVAAVAPWVAAEADVSDRGVLERTKGVIENLPRRKGVAGRWYGVFAQTTTNEEGESFAFSEFVKVDLSEGEDGGVEGDGILGSGEELQISGEVDGQELSGSVANTTSGINVTLSAIAAETQITGEFSGYGAGQTLSGTVLLLR